MRLSKYLAHSGVASRRHAENLITSGRVTMDGERVLDPARDVGDESEVRVDGEAVRPERHEYHLVNKPLGVVSTAHDPQGRPKVTDLVESDVRLYPVGRLDADTTGLLVLTNDGELANRLMHPRFEVSKGYRARVKGYVRDRALKALRSGVDLEDGRTAPAEVSVEGRSDSESVLEIAIREGRKRQVRRMLEEVGHPVIELERTSFGPLRRGRLARGGSRRWRPAEIEALRTRFKPPPRTSGGGASARMRRPRSAQ